MALTLDEAATMLGVSSSTVQRWSRQGLLGARMPTGEFTFDAHELRRWARNNGLTLKPLGGLKAAVPIKKVDPKLPFVAALERGAIFRGLPGQDPVAVLSALVGEVPLTENRDRVDLKSQLLRREAMSTTGLGHGVALPHPRTPSARFAQEPRVFLALLDQAIDWNAIDGEPVHSVFLLLSPDPTRHLTILSRVAFLLRDADFCSMLARKVEDDVLLTKMAATEATCR